MANLRYAVFDYLGSTWNGIHTSDQAQAFGSMNLASLYLFRNIEWIKHPRDRTRDRVPSPSKLPAARTLILDVDETIQEPFWGDT